MVVSTDKPTLAELRKRRRATRTRRDRVISAVALVVLIWTALSILFALTLGVVALFDLVF